MGTTGRSCWGWLVSRNRSSMGYSAGMKRIIFDEQDGEEMRILEGGWEAGS